MKSVISSLITLCTIIVSSEITSAEYSPKIGEMGWQLSNAAYCSDDTILRWDCKNCKASGIDLKEIVTMSHGGSRAFVGYDANDNAIYVVFMGSHNLHQWINNIDSVLTKYPYCTSCNVHAGFYKAYLNIVEEIREGVKVLKSNHTTATLRIIGHSLGGAVSVHAAADLFVNLKLVPEYVYTYGQPRVGDKFFYMWYGHQIKNHWRLTHARDMVPHLPPESFGFHHTALEIFYEGPPPKFKKCDGSGEDGTCADQYYSASSIVDHLTYMGGKCCCLP